MEHPCYNRQNFPHFVVNHGNWDICRSDSDHCAAIPVDPESGCKATHFGDMAYVRSALADILPRDAKVMDTPVFTMSVETIEGVKPHGFHLGTDRAIAESFVFERLKAGAMSVALYFNGKAVKIYDFRDIQQGSSQ